MTPRKAINGRESSVLALIAQAGDTLTIEERLDILDSLKGPALRIAKVMLRITKNPSPADKRASDGFFAWAEELGNKP